MVTEKMGISLIKKVITKTTRKGYQNGVNRKRKV